jgi:cysteine synthase A
LIYKDIVDAIKLPSIIELSKNFYVIRFESLKIFSVLEAVRRLLKTGVIKKGDTLIDSSSGLYAHALALVCNQYDLNCHIIASTAVDSTLIAQLKILGAKVEQIKSAKTLKADQKQRVARIKKILAKNPHIYWMQQYHDDIHYHGYRQIALLIKETIGINKLSIIGSVGTGCSTGGIIQTLRKFDPSIELIGIQPFGSITFHANSIQDPDIMIAGIGSNIPFNNVKHEVYDWIHWISFRYSMSAAVHLLKKYGIFAGLSTGASYLVANQAVKAKPNRKIIFIAADTGHRYVDTVFTKYKNAFDIAQLAPVEISNLKDLSLPWSCYRWNRQFAPK